MNQDVNHPIHYLGASAIGMPLLKRHLGLSKDVLDKECIDFLESDRKYCGFHLGNAVKYLWRCGSKCDAKGDLLKALWYLDRWEDLNAPLHLRLWDFLTRSPNLKARIAVCGLIADLEDIIDNLELKPTQETSRG